VKQKNYISASVATLSLLAAALASFLLWQSLSGAAIPGCGGGSSCDSVLSSRFSRIGPVPVSAAALPIFLMIIFCSIATLSANPRLRNLSRQLLLPLAIIDSGAAIWFISIQAFILHRFCN